MTLSALLVCVEEAAAAVLRRVLEELSIKVEACPDFARAAIRLAQDRFDVIVVDGESNAEVVQLLRESRMSRLNEATLAVVVVSDQESVRELFSLGVNFALYKPVAYDRALSSMRAARALMRKEKRRSKRAMVHTQATVDYANVESDKATLIDVAQDGMQVQFGRKLPPTSKVYFQFLLPGQSMSVRLSGQVMWQDWNGRAGVQFLDVPKASRKLLADFMGAHLQKDSGDELGEVTVEMEEPLQMAAVSVHEQTQGTRHTSGTAGQMESEQQSASHPDTQNRRHQARYACRIGSEVFRTGASVPHHCCLTDLSSGGCYLEVNLPFPQGVSVEIVVRTYELKLRLRGSVQASHPGYGMGIAFELKTKEERDSVKKLLDFVAATNEPSK